MSSNKYTIEQFTQAVKQSTSIRQVLMKLNLAPKGGGYQTFHKLAKELNLDTSHFTGQGHNKGKTFPPKTPTEKYLNNSVPINSYRLKNRLLNEGILTPSCSNCKSHEWLNKPIPLELDHIDGCNSNNNLDNLRLLCPNCHALTDTYRGKNQKRAKKS